MKNWNEESKQYYKKMTKLNIIMYGRTLYVYTLNKLLLLLLLTG